MAYSLYRTHASSKLHIPTKLTSTLTVRSAQHARQTADLGLQHGGLYLFSVQLVVQAVDDAVLCRVIGGQGGELGGLLAAPTVVLLGYAGAGLEEGF